NYPQNLLDEHSNWHMHPGNPAQGGRAIWPGQPGSGLEFFTFHRTFLAHFHAWYDTQPGADQAAVAPWTAIPPALKVDAVGWTQWQARQKTVIKDVIDGKGAVKDIKEHKEFIKDIKEHKEFIKDIKEHPEKLPKEIKEKDKDIFEGGGLPGGGGDPAFLITQL